MPVFGKLLSNFWGASPIIDEFWPQISSNFPSGATNYNKNQSKYVLNSSNQIFLLITTHFGEHRRVFGKLLSDFWGTSPIIDDFWPQISSNFPSGATHYDKNQSKHVLTSSNQICLLIITHFGGHR